MNFSSISQEEFKRLLNKKESIILDVRTPREINNGKITKNTKELDFYNPNFKEKLKNLDKDKNYLVYCAHGNRSKDTIKIMKDLNFKKAHDLEGGITTWKEPLL